MAYEGYDNLFMSTGKSKDTRSMQDAAGTGGPFYREVERVFVIYTIIDRFCGPLYLFLIYHTLNLCSEMAIPCGTCTVLTVKRLIRKYPITHTKKKPDGAFFIS